jgi:syndecan 1
VVQRSASNSEPVTQLAQAAGVGPVPGTPSYRIAPLLSVQRLPRPVVTSNSPQNRQNRVAPAVWRRPADLAAATVRVAAPPSDESRPGVDIVAMGSARPVGPTVLPVTHVQRTPPAASPPPPRVRSASAPPAFNRPTTASTEAKTPQAVPRKPDPLEGIEMDKLARQLFEPISRLLRADLRRGRERAGAGHDHRR